MKNREPPAAKPICVSLDLQEMRTSMTLWRDTLVLCHPQAQRDSGLRVIQRKMLNDLDRTLTGWLDLLKMCTAEGSDAIDLQNIRAEVAECKEWTEESLAATYLNDTVRSLPPADRAT